MVSHRCISQVSALLTDMGIISISVGLGEVELVQKLSMIQELDFKYKLKQEGYLVYAVEQTHNSIALNQFKPSKDSKIALVFGNEAEGVSEESILSCDGAIEIPQFGSKHSFNISVSAGIVLWDIFNKMKG